MAVNVNLLVLNILQVYTKVATNASKIVFISKNKLE